VPIDRDATLKQAEKLLRQGRLDGAIAEYVRLVQEQPKDWNSRNALGDLYVRAGQTDKAIEQFTAIADALNTEGFFQRAAALYKKVLKLREDEHSQLRLVDIAVRQGLLADAKMYLRQVGEQRRFRGDTTGQLEIVIRLGTIDPDDADAKRAAARAARRPRCSRRPPRFTRSRNGRMMRGRCCSKRSSSTRRRATTRACC
jgi:pilus assembly protein FimV